MKRLLLASVFSLAFGWASAQQLPQFTQYQLNNFVTNPAVAGTNTHWQAKSNNRYQWVGINDAPRTFVFSLYGPLFKNMGIGGYLFNDVTGPTRRLGAQIAYAYNIKIKDDLRLSFGGSFGMQYAIVDGAKITTQQLGDLALSNGIQTKINPDASGGLWLYSDKYFVGISAPQMLTAKLDFFDDYPETESKLERHYYITGGYTFDITDDIAVQPSLQAKYVDPIIPQVDLGARAIYKDMVWVGAYYRTAEEITVPQAVTAQLGYTFQQNLTFAYSYDVSLSDIRNYSSGSHEIMFALRFMNTRSPK